MHNPILVSAWHFGAFERFRHMRKEVLTRKRPIQIVRQTAICLKHQKIVGAAAIAIRFPDLFEIGANIRNERITSLE